MGRYSELMLGKLTNLGKHVHGDTRLKCQDCAEAICPKCMIQCAVGFRCPKCASRFTSHVVQLTPLVLIRTAISAGVTGLLFGYFERYLPHYGFYSWIILFAVGFGAGKLLHRIASYKLGTKLVVTVVASLLLGLAVSPLRDAVFQCLFAVKNATGEDGTGDTLAPHLITTGIFVAGLLTPFLRR